jgi:DNA (cytosine-5)-methyltransferase 1
MKHASLFSGIGGFDLAAEWMGWENIFHCEWNPFGQRVLKHHFPKSKSYEDITKTDFTIHRGQIDILTGGFPCQPYSTAGKRLGKDDERHLWPHMLRAISEIKPSWVVGENVRGLVNWNEGLVFHEVQSDLENQGYEVQPFLIPAAGVNAPHQRYRIWFIAYSKTNRSSSTESVNEWEKYKSNDRDSLWDSFSSISSSKNATDTNSDRFQRSISTNINKQISSEKKYDEKCLSAFRHGIQFENFPTVSPICNGDDGLSDRLDNITLSKWRKESIKAGGNAIVPQVALQIFKAINEYERINSI